MAARPSGERREVREPRPAGGGRSAPAEGGPSPAPPGRHARPDDVQFRRPRGPARDAGRDPGRAPRRLGVGGSGARRVPPRRRGHGARGGRDVDPARRGDGPPRRGGRGHRARPPGWPRTDRRAREGPRHALRGARPGERERFLRKGREQAAPRRGSRGAAHASPRVVFPSKQFAGPLRRPALAGCARVRSKRPSPRRRPAPRGPLRGFRGALPRQRGRNQAPPENRTRALFRGAPGPVADLGCGRGDSSRHSPRPA